ncbi:Exopolygalacturonase [Orbilia brochopaga]|nr:Exopolygalacturonase [Drechslerella brochopaga]
MGFKAAFLSLLLLASSTLATDGSVSHSTTNGRKTCTVYAYKKEKNKPPKDDVPHLLKAFNDCGNGGYIRFPAGQEYFIGQRLQAVLNDVKIDWHGVWQFSDDLDYWRANSYRIAFQNHRAGFTISGDDIIIDGFGTGGIDGNGDAWYNAEHGSTQEGRPMPFVFWNVSQVTVNNFFVRQSPLWAINIMNGTDMYFTNITSNSTAHSAPYGSNWVQNTDGFNTMDARNIYLNGFTYQGGDDCVAIKPRSYNIYVSDVLCHGGNGIAIGSLGQYLEDSSVENVWIDNVRIVRYNEDMHNSAYIKTWIGFQAPQSGYESENQPRGGGNIVWANFTGTVSKGKKRASISCSKVNPCYNIAFEGLDLVDAATGAVPSDSCSNVASHGVRGLAASACNV